MSTSPEPTRDVRCPNCNAQPGKTCTQPTDTGRRPVHWLHLSRIDSNPIRITRETV